MKCVIIEDELLAQEVLEHYISKVPGLKLLAKYNNAIDFIKHYQSLEKIDLVFLDINMPEVSGLDLLKMIKDLPDVI